MRLQLLWIRITFTRLTTIYFTFSVVHCVVQLILQSRAFQINNQAAIFLHNVVVQGNAIWPGLLGLTDDDLHMCDSLPPSLDVRSCPVVFDGSPGSPNAVNADNQRSSSSLPSSSSTATRSSSTVVMPSSTLVALASTTSLALTRTAAARTSLSKQGTVTKFQSQPASTVVISSLPNPNNRAQVLPIHKNVRNTATVRHSGKNLSGRQFPSIQPVQTQNGTQVTLNGYGWHGAPAILDQRCLMTLNYPLYILHNTKREDIVFIAFHLWVLGISVVALLNQSIPHILASLLTHMLATAWAGFQISHTAQFRKQFIQLTIKGACSPLNLLPDYWKNRGIAEISSLALNITSLLISSILTWKLVQLFGWQTFKRIGASLQINRCYKFVLTLSITIQLSLFFMFVSVSLWLDQLFNGPIGRFASLAILYKISSFSTLVTLIPWLMIGWYAVHREQRLIMMFFLMLSVAYLAGWAFMFLSLSFRWTFWQWRLFSLMISASVLLTLAAFVLGVVCRFNFGKGLTRYLQEQDYVDGDDSDYRDSSSDVEKIDFPSRNTSLFTTYAPGYAQQLNFQQISIPPPVFTGSLPIHQVERKYSESHKSDSSGDGNNQHGRSPSETSQGQNTKRWVIE